MGQLFEIDETAPDRPSCYERADGTVVYRASALGHCIGALTRERLNIDPDMPPDWMEAAFEWGTEAEPETLRQLASKGFKLLDEWDLESQFVGHEVHNGQLETTLAVGTSAIINCHPDGIADVFIAPVDNPELPVGTRVVVEAKRLSNSWAWDVIKGGADALPPYYKYQVAVEMHSTGLPCVFMIAVSDKETHEITDYEYIIITEPPIPLNLVKLRVMKIEAAAARGELPDCDYAMWPCGFWRDHDTEQGVWVTSKKGKSKQREKKGEAVKAEDVGLDVDKLELHVRNLIRTRDIIENLGPAAKKEAQGEIDKLFDKAGQKGGRITTPNFDVNDIVTSNPGKIDWKAYAYELGGTDDGAEKHRGKGWDLRYSKVIPLTDD